MTRDQFQYRIEEAGFVLQAEDATLAVFARGKNEVVYARTDADQASLYSRVRSNGQFDVRVSGKRWHVTNHLRNNMFPTQGMVAPE